MERKTCHCGKPVDESGRCNDGCGFHLPKTLASQEQTITPEQRAREVAKKFREAGERHRDSEDEVLRLTANADLLAAETIEGLLQEIPYLRQEALAQGWAACEKEVIYKGRYFNECKGWLHVDMKDIANPHKDAAA